MCACPGKKWWRFLDICSWFLRLIVGFPHFPTPILHSSAEEVIQLNWLFQIDITCFQRANIVWDFTNNTCMNIVYAHDSWPVWFGSLSTSIPRILSMHLFPVMDSKPLVRSPEKVFSQLWWFSPFLDSLFTRWDVVWSFAQLVISQS